MKTWTRAAVRGRLEAAVDVLDRLWVSVGPAGIRPSWPPIVRTLTERSTWLGVLTLLGVVGVSVSPEQKELIVSAGLAVGAVILAFTKDKTGGTNV